MQSIQNLPEARTESISIEKPEELEIRPAALSTARFWDRMAERYAAKAVPDSKAYARKLEITREYLNPDSTVLELGCGTGSTAIAHAPYVGHIKASDYSSNMIDIARKKAAGADVHNIDFVCSVVSEETASNARYDVVLALNTLHLLVDWQDTIKAVHGLLRAGGVFVTSTACLMDAPAWLRWLAPIGAGVGLMPPLSFFDQDELQSVLLDAGFEVERCWQANSKNGLFLVVRKPYLASAT